MPISEYLASLREAVGHRLLLLPAVAAILRDENGRVLLMRSAESGAWSLPAGAVEPGESPEEAVAREVAEETSLVVRAARLVAAVGGAEYRVQYPNGDRVEYVVSVYECETAPGLLHAADGEAAGFHWADPGTVPSLLDLPYPPALFHS